MLERIKALEHKLKDLEGVSNGLWESLDHQVGAVEAKANVHDLGSYKAPQSDGQIVGIEEAQKQLGDVIKALDKEVKDSIVAL